jgi:hypothetical protein
MMQGTLRIRSKAQQGADFCRAWSWLRGVDLNHRPLGYEPSTLSLIWRNLIPVLG